MALFGVHFSKKCSILRQKYLSTPSLGKGTNWDYNRGMLQDVILIAIVFAVIFFYKSNSKSKKPKDGDKKDGGKDKK